MNFDKAERVSQTVTFELTFPALVLTIAGIISGALVTAFGGLFVLLIALGITWGAFYFFDTKVKLTVLAALSSVDSKD